MRKIQLNVINLYQCDPAFQTDIRILPFDYLLYVHKGKGIFKIGKTKYTAKMGDMFYCPPGTENVIIADETDPFLLSGIECHLGEIGKKLEFEYHLLTSPFLIQCILQMIQEFQYSLNGINEICDALLMVLVISLERKEKNLEVQEISESIVHYITNHFQESITHKDLTNIFHYHKNTINRFIQRKTGLSLKNYLIQLRIRKAEELLKYSDKSVKEIAELCGYGSEIYLCKQFKEKQNITPAQYRKKFRNRK